MRTKSMESCSLCRVEDIPQSHPAVLVSMKEGGVWTELPLKPNSEFSSRLDLATWRHIRGVTQILDPHIGSKPTVSPPPRCSTARA
jgi:hypothetical protein